MVARIVAAHIAASLPLWPRVIAKRQREQVARYLTGVRNPVASPICCDEFLEFEVLGVVAHCRQGSLHDPPGDAQVVVVLGDGALEAAAGAAEATLDRPLAPRLRL
eukprot:CAMPEP_0176133678 /NCGR_PEP_ID=MMETSP0120_2-20121206/67775_1 /TAXON_ID=160619 /ORGANISM="Kryptoperidinium foliaceum, Strain CCMP 1326" /LENGTH=105 /DNA_ID=CAMNT_0017469283 /DNA_START=61 /DNA_END=374 /DNA_ORIENTATION=+